MSETRPENEAPFLVLRGRLTSDKRIRAYRSSALRLIGMRMLIFFAAVLVIAVGVNAYYGLPLFDFSSLFSRPVFWVMVAVVIGAYCIEFLWLRPQRLRKQLTELYGDTEPWETEYAFFADSFGYRVLGAKNQGDIRLQYTDLKTMKVHRWYVLLRTRANTKLAFTRQELSAEDGKKLVDTLRERSSLPRQE